MNLALQGRFLPVHQQALAYLVQQNVGGLVRHPEVATQMQGRNAFHGVHEKDDRCEVKAQGQLVLVEGENRSGGHREILAAARTAPNLAGWAEVVPVDHAAVRADHVFPIAPALAAEQGECVIVTQRQNLNQRQATGFSSQQKMPTHGAASWVSFMSISVRPDSLTACDCEKFRRRRAVASGRRALGWLLHKAVGFLRPCRHSSQSHGVPHALTQLTPDPLLDGCGDVLRSGEDQGLVTDVGSWLTSGQAAGARTWPWANWRSADPKKRRRGDYTSAQRFSSMSKLRGTPLAARPLERSVRRHR